MAIHFAPMGTNGSDFGPIWHTWVESYMENTAIDLYLSFGISGATTQTEYTNWVGSVLDDTIGDGSTKLIVDVWEAALNDLRDPNPDYTKIDAVASAYASHAKVGGFFIEEPIQHNWPASTVVNRAKARLGNSRPLIVDVDYTATQAQFSGYASYCDWLCSYYYPRPNGQWANIEHIVNDNGPIYYMKNANPARPYYFCVEVQDDDPTSTPSEAEINWMTHRALTYGAGGIFFFNWARRWKKGVDGDATAVRNVCQKIEGLDLHNILIGTNKDALVSGSMYYAAYAYRQSSDNDYYLLVVEKTPESSGSHSFTADCDLESGFSYFDHCEEMYHNPGTAVTVHDAGGTKKRLNGNLERGQVKLYRFFINT